MADIPQEMINHTITWLGDKDETDEFEIIREFEIEYVISEVKKIQLDHKILKSG